MPLLLALALLPLPDLNEVQRFPPMPLVNARIGFLIEQRHFLAGQIAFKPQEAARWRQLLIKNDHDLGCYEALLEARGGCGEEFCREALGRLKALLGERDWFAGMMP